MLFACRRRVYRDNFFAGRLGWQHFFTDMSRPTLQYDSQVRNLLRHPQTGKLWLFDNEFGIGISYRRYGSTGVNNDMLRTFCIFRRSTVRNLFRLASLDEPPVTLIDSVRRDNELYQNTDLDLWINTFFTARLRAAVKWIARCENTFSL